MKAKNYVKVGLVISIVLHVGIFALGGYVMNNITKELSKEFRFSYEKHYDNNLDEINVLNISGGAGLSYKIHNDILVYNLGKIGTGINFEKGYPYTSFETGIIIYEILNMKTVLSHEFIYNQDSSNNMYQKLNLNQSLFIEDRKSVV